MQIERCKNPLPLRWQGAYLMLLKKAGLHDEGDCEETVLAWDGETLLGCASLRGRVIKQIAVLPEAAGAGVAAALVSALVHRAAELERTHLFCYTKPEKQRLFRALGFFPLASTDWAVLLENRRDGVKTFLAGLPQADGCVVCNANPFTLGHLHLISEAARQCTRVIVFVLSAEQPMFPASVRLALVQRGCEAMKNVTVVSGGDYLISRETFPGYFLKDIGTADMAYAALELHLFAGRIAPALGIRRRFVGEEPFCPVTAAYNAAMRDILPRAGIAVTVLPRWRNISAGEVRRLLEQGRVEETKEMLPEVTYEYCADHFGAGTACP